MAISNIAAALLPLLAFLPGESARNGDSVTLEIVPESSSIGPGRLFHLAVVLSIEKGWHVYWRDPGASGLATAVEVTAPAGFVVKPARYARPRAFEEPQGTVFGYEGEAVLLVPVEAPASLAEGATARFTVEATWLACREACVLGGASATVDLAAGRPAPASGRFAALAKRIPEPLSRLPGAAVRLDGTTLVVTGPAASAFRSATLFPEETPGATFGRPAGAVSEGTFTARVDVKLSPRNAEGRPIVLRGVIALGDAPDDPGYEFELEVPAPPLEEE